MTDEDVRLADQVHAALCGNGLNNDVANFLTDLLVRLRELERKVKNIETDIGMDF